MILPPERMLEQLVHTGAKEIFCRFSGFQAKLNYQKKMVGFCSRKIFLILQNFKIIKKALILHENDSLISFFLKYNNHIQLDYLFFIK